MKVLGSIVLSLWLLLALAGCASETRDAGSVHAGSISAPAEPTGALPPPGPAVCNDYTIAWMSDPQFYSADYPHIFDSMTQWVHANAEKENIRYTLITGDLVNESDSSEQWGNAVKAVDYLGREMPLMTLAGNHDLLDGDDPFATYLTHFGRERFDSVPTLGEYYRDGVGRYDILEIGGKSLLLVSMSYGVSEDGIAWINDVLSQHKTMTAILALHGFVYPDGSYTSDGKTLLEPVVKQNSNVRMVLCGHKHGVNHSNLLVDDNGDGKVDRTVYQFVGNYQSEAEGGSGYFFLLTFDAERGQLLVRSYSAYKDDYNLYPDGLGVEEFVLPFPIA